MSFGNFPRGRTQGKEHEGTSGKGGEGEKKRKNKVAGSIIILLLL